MKKIMFVMPLIAISLLASCGGNNTPSVEYYTVGFDTDGGSYIAPQKVEKGKTATPPTTEPTHSSTQEFTFTFDGWDFDFTTPISSDTTIKAKWNKETQVYTVTFNANGGRLVGETKQTITVPYGKKFSQIDGIASQEAEKELCLFNGWALTPSDKNPLNADNDYDIKGDLEVYAILVPQNTVKLTFNGTNCHLWKNNIMQEGVIDIISGINNIFTIEPVDSYLPVFLNPVTSTDTVKCEFNPATKQLIVNANQDCTVTASTTKQTLEECTWSEIDSISEAGLADDCFDIGDTKTVTINTKIHTVRIIGFNHDKDSEGNNLGITFEFANVITDSYGDAVTTKWDSNYNYDYRKSILNSFLNNDVLNMLPSSGDIEHPNLKEVIKPVDKKVGVSATEKEGVENYAATSFDGDTYPYPYLFPLAYDEMHNPEKTPIEVTPGEAGDAGIYEYYKNYGGDEDDDNARRVKNLVDGSAADYYLRSPSAFNNKVAFLTLTRGILSTAYELSGIESIAPAFCI